MAPVLCSVGSGEDRCYVVRTRKQPHEKVHLARDQGLLPTASGGLPSLWISYLEMNLPSTLSEDSEACTSELSKHFYYRIHIHSFIQSSDITFTFMRSYRKIIITLHPAKRWQIRICSCTTPLDRNDSHNFMSSKLFPRLKDFSMSSTYWGLHAATYLPLLFRLWCLGFWSLYPHSVSLCWKAPLEKVPRAVGLANGWRESWRQMRFGNISIN